MMRKFVILGLLLLLAGTAAFQWVLAEKRKEQKQAAYYKSKGDSELSKYLEQYKEWLSLPPQERAELPLSLDKYGKTKTNAQRVLEQKQRLKADLDKLATGEIDAHPYADILYGRNWQEELSKYKKRKELREFILTGSIVCACVGGAIVAGCLLIYPIWLVIRHFSGSRRCSVEAFRNQRYAENNNLNETDAEGSRKAGSQIYEENLYDDSQDSRIPLTQLLDLRDTSFSVAGAIKDEPQETAAAGYPKTSTIQIKDSLKSQVENLEKQVEEIRKIAENTFSQEAAKSQSDQNVQQAIAEHTGLLNDTLVELTQQVGAIREYASSQQDRVRKLQDGYDLNIIKNFCIRVIRCIDNLESFINGQAEQNIEVTPLKEARDELLFALESSGVEQFEPEINSDYRGEVWHAEAIKEKEHCDDPLLSGKIAKVIKPGYQYFIDEENVKVVRPAMVKLFG